MPDSNRMLFDKTNTGADSGAVTDTTSYCYQPTLVFSAPATHPKIFQIISPKKDWLVSDF